MSATLREQVLINARALIADPAHWTRGTLARTERDEPIEWHKASAAKWCVLGALYRAAYDLVGSKEQAMRLADGVTDSIYPRRWLRSALPTLNDRGEHAAVVAVIEKALASR